MRFILIILLLISTPAVAQLDSIFLDSINLHERTLQHIRTSDSLRVSDSLEKEVLKRQIQDLTKYETKKRTELEARLQEITISDSLRKLRSKNEIDSLKLVAKGFPVVPYKDTLFYIYTKVGNITPSERAEIINERLIKLYEEFIPQLDSLILVDYGPTVDIMFKDRTIVSITEADGMWFEKPKSEIASNYKDLIISNLNTYKENKSLLTLLKQIGLAILVIVLQIGLIRGVNYLFKNKVDAYIISQKGNKIQGFKIKDYQFLDEERFMNVILFISKIIRWGLNALQLYLTLPLLFSIFPPTQRLAETLFGYILTPLKKFGSEMISFAPNLFTILVIVVLTTYFIRFLRFLASEIEQENLKIQGFYPDWAQPTFNIVRVLTLAFMFIMIFPYLPGSNSPVFQGVSVFLGIMFSLGSSSIIGNMIAGIVMTYMRPFQIGDRIKIGDILGDVVEKTPFVTRLKTPKNEYITIPNSNILSSNVINFSTSQKEEGIIFHTTITIGYDVPWRQVHELLITAAKKSKYISNVPEPFVLQTGLDDFYVSYQLNAYSNAPGYQSVIYSELHQNIQDAFNEAGVEILSPHYRAQRDGNQVTTPPEYLSPEYEAPSFRVQIQPEDKKQK